MAGFDYDEIIYRNGAHQSDADHLGSGRVQIYIPKDYVRIKLDGDVLDLDDTSYWGAFFAKHDVDYSIEVLQGDNGVELRGNIAEHQFQTHHVGGNMVDVELIEPDGTIWQARGGYETGERFLGDVETPETFYRRLMSRRFEWTQVQTKEAH